MGFRYGRNLPLTHLAVISEVDCIPWGHGQSGERTPQISAHFIVRRVFMDMRPTVALALCRFDQTISGPAVGGAAAQAIEGTAARQSDNPSQRLALRWEV